MTDVLLTVRTTAGVSGDQCMRTAYLLNQLLSRLYDYTGDSDDRLLEEAKTAAEDWERLGNLCKRNESQEQVTL